MQGIKEGPLPVQECIDIIAKRLWNLNNGSGDFSPENRALAVWNAECDLANALADLKQEQRKAMQRPS